MSKPVRRRKSRHSQSKLKKLLHDKGASPGSTQYDAMDSSSPISPNSPKVATADASQGDLSFYKVPLTVLYYFAKFTRQRTTRAVSAFLSRRDWLTWTFGVTLFLLVIHAWQGPHSNILAYVDGVVIWYTYWVLLGVASSIGLGAGLHTFVLFLGPHIVEVTMAAYECGHLDFDVRGPHSFECRPHASLVPITVLQILKKVMLASLCWGAGTAIGELPPYFMARAAALAGRKNPELDALNSLQETTNQGELSIKTRALLIVYSMLQRLGFLGIFLFASIPNPLFDLAGITCGHFLVPFPTFFGATFLGKSVVKSTIQTMTVILIFSKGSLDRVLQFVGRYSPDVRHTLEKFINNQMLALQHKDKVSNAAGSTSLLSWAWNGFIVATLLYFVISIMESCATTCYEEDQQLVSQSSAKCKNGPTKVLS
ncbi:hypothetical protein IWQ62_006015 [Dispira parvispora]|uniref:Golgi apparatus membrane protein tvp38 n=1 Tax=Dispira parvispora TaxID=1520584 RepID=A0A9W8DZ12_9FUNG|nr:hypothetical protein IWQ62_006015 [Dispira parvispora]